MSDPQFKYMKLWLRPIWPFDIGQRVRKVRGSEWEGYVCGFYATELNPNGIAVESASHKGSVQIYPAEALEPVEETIPAHPKPLFPITQRELEDNRHERSH